MKKYLLISIFIIGCTPNAPENLISEEKMESIISVSYTHLRAHETS